MSVLSEKRNSQLNGKLQESVPYIKFKDQPNYQNIDQYQSYQYYIQYMQISYEASSQIYQKTMGSTNLHNLVLEALYFNSTD